ncbi:MAG: hypothetical protein IK136_02105, partial [Oscillospiraceae bacterium]|nr:hypothetical protein [Oscillospiraceae bacterium]
GRAGAGDVARVHRYFRLDEYEVDQTTYRLSRRIWDAIVCIVVPTEMFFNTFCAETAFFINILNFCPC